MVVRLHPPRRRLTGPAALETWSLQRIRSIPDVMVGDLVPLTQTLGDARLVGALFVYRGRAVRPRPGVAALIAVLLASAGRSIGIADLSARIHGGPMSMRALRQVTFRANRVFEQVECPLVAHCRAGQAFVRIKVWPFERSGAVRHGA